MWGLKIHLECPYFASFRHPTSTSLILTYTIPPYTTIRGLIANALGLPRDYWDIQNWFKIGIKLLYFEKNREMAKILKLKGDAKIYKRKFSSSPMFREFLVEPKYDVFIVGEKEILERIHTSLKSPKRPLYLGTSDDVVDLSVEKPVKVEYVNGGETMSVIGGFYENCIVERVPYSFIKTGKNISVEFKTVSIPYKKPVKTDMKMADFGGGEYVWVI